MYKQLILACDQTRESLVALREGAIIAQTFAARAHLMVIDQETPGLRVAEGLSGYRLPSPGADLLQLGLSRLGRLGVAATGEVVRGEIIPLLQKRVTRLGADLIVLGHKRQSFIDRWWSGSSGGYIVDRVPCSLLIARDTITDEEFERRIQAATGGTVPSKA